MANPLGEEKFLLQEGWTFQEKIVRKNDSKKKVLTMLQ